jgi:hypothetical protein
MLSAFSHRIHQRPVLHLATVESFLLTAGTLILALLTILLLFLAAAAIRSS